MSAFECFAIAALFDISDSISRHRPGYDASLPAVIFLGFSIAGIVKTVWP